MVLGMVNHAGCFQKFFWTLVTYLLHAFLSDIPNHCHLPSLSHSMRTADRLFFNRRVPLRLDKVHSISYGQREAITLLVSTPLLVFWGTT